MTGNALISLLFRKLIDFFFKMADLFMFFILVFLEKIVHFLKDKLANSTPSESVNKSIPCNMVTELYPI